MKFICRFFALGGIFLLPLILKPVTANHLEFGELRFTCQEANAIIEKADRIFIRLIEIIQRQRELAIQAANGTLGSTDRAYLNIEYAALNSEANQLISRASFTDSYGEVYAFLKDGIQFRTLRYSSIDQVSVPIDCKVDAFEMKTLGSLAKIQLQINSQVNLPDDYLMIRQASIPVPADWDDIVSSADNRQSSIALARRINSAAGATLVFADILENVINFEDMKLNENFILKVGDFTINRVNVTGKFSSATALILLINQVSSSTGVKAVSIRNQVNEMIGMKLYAADGRNIEIQAAESLLPIFNGKIKSGKNIFYGGIELRSGAPFEMTTTSPIFGFVGKKQINLTNESLPETNILEQANAQGALAYLDNSLRQVNSRRARLAPLMGMCPPN
jgi:flagellin-like hook-associated protein FlgL